MTEPQNKLYASAKIWKRSLFYVFSLLFFSLLLLYFSWNHHSGFIANPNWVHYLLFFAFALFCDFSGFPDANFGYVSFERVAQVSSILIVGPIPAALINGASSLVFPLLRNYLNGDFRAIFIAIVNNTAMMLIMIIVSGMIFEYLGGDLPLTSLTIKQFALLCVLVLSLELLNVLCMQALIKIRAEKISNYFSRFSIITEVGSGFLGVLVALAYAKFNFAEMLLFIVIVVVTLLVINQYATIRNSLEKKVAKRTEKLNRRTQQLEHIATHDELTGLVNRRFINSHIEKLLAQAKIIRAGMFIAFADIDDFKHINDTYSHDAGDEVLIKISQILQSFCNENLIISRYGGEEFLMCFSQLSQEKVLALCEDIRQQISAIDLHNISKNLHTSVSIGLAKAQKNALHKSLISQADKSLYEAKENGKNQVVYGTA